MGLWDRLFPPPDKSRFARIMTRTLRDRGETRSIEYNQAEFCLRIGGDFVFFLGNAYQDYLAAPRRMRKEVLRHYSRLPAVAEQAETELSAARPNILPKVRERFYHESLKLQMQREGKGTPGDFPTRVFSEDLTVEVVYDHPESVQIIHKDLLAGWGIGLDEALAIGRENLWHRSNEDFLQPSPGVYCSPWRDTHDASRLFLHDLIWQLKVSGDHVAMVPHRDFLFVTGSEDVAGLCRMAELADELLQQTRSMSGVALRLEDSRWVSFMPPESSRAYVPLRLPLVRAACQQYAEQTNLLHALYEKTHQDIYVANASPVRTREGVPYSFAVWVDGVTDALLPRVDRINFGHSGPTGKHESLGFAKWDRVVEAAGELMEQTDLYPPRYRIRRFPEPEQLRAMEIEPA